MLINAIYERINKLRERKGWRTGREREDRKGEKETADRQTEILTLEIPNKSTKRSVIF